MKTRYESSYILQLVEQGEHDRQDFKFAITDARKIARSLSAFANTHGGRLLVGVKDNGKIAGVRSDEEIYMIEAAATVYCHPPLQTENLLHQVDGKTILEVIIPEATDKPIYALDEEGKPKAYIRIADENILANVVHLNIWKHDKQKREVIIAYTQKEQQLLALLSQRGPLTLNQCVHYAQLDRRRTALLLADFIRFGLVRQIFDNHRFYFTAIS